MLHDVILVVVFFFIVGRTSLQSMLLTMLTMKKRVAWFSISVRARGSVQVIVRKSCLAALQGIGAPL